MTAPHKAARFKACLVAAYIGVAVGIINLDVQAQVLAPASASVNEVGQLMQKGRDLLGAGNMSEAAQVFLQVVRMDDRQAEAFYHLAILSFQSGDYQRGFGFVNRSIELSPDQPLPRMAFAKALGETRAYDEALVQYQQILSMVHPEHPMYGEIRKQMDLIKVRRFPQIGEYADVSATAGALMANYPEDPGVMHVVASFFILVQRLDEAEAIYTELIRKIPRNPSYRYYLGNIYDLKGMYEEAEEAYERVTKMISRASLATQAQLKLLLARGRKYQQKGDLVLAEQQFTEALAMEPNNTIALTGIANVRIEEKKPEEAEALLNRVLRVNPLDIEARYRLAITYLVRGMFNKGLQSLDMIGAAAQSSPFANAVNATMFRLQQELGDERIAAIRQSNVALQSMEHEVEIDSSNPHSYLKLSESYLASGAVAEAMEALARAIELDPELGEAYKLRGDLYEQRRQHKEAIADYKKALVSLDQGELFDEVELRLLKLQAQASMADAEWDAAEEAYSQILARKENDRDAMVGLAQVAAQRGNVEVSIERYLNVMEMYPDDIEARINLAMSYERAEKEEEAILQYKKASLVEGIRDRAKDFALDRMKRLQQRINGFTYSFSYGLSADTQVRADSFEYSSSTGANVVYNYKINEYFRTSVVLAPGYSTYHVGQHDFMNIGVTPTLQYSLFDLSHSVGFSRSSRYGVLREDQSVTRSQNVFYGLSWAGDEGVSYSVQVSTRDFLSEQNPFFDADTYSVNVTRQQTFYDLPSSLGYSLTVNNNRQSLGNDYAYVSHGLTGRLDKLLTSKTSVFFNGAVGVTLYQNRDSSTSFQMFRRNWNMSFGMGANYRFDNRFSFYGGYSYFMQESNLEVGFVLDEIQLIEGEDARVAYQSGSLGDSDGHSINMGIQVRL